MQLNDERFVPDQQGDMKPEHMHHYACAADLASAKDVLDIRDGGNSGATILAHVARSVVELDISGDATRHAQQRGQQDNVRFCMGSAGKFPLPDAAFDLVVWVGAVVRSGDLDPMLAEIRRVLRPGGVLMVSGLGEVPGQDNEEALRKWFANVAAYGQRLIAGSLLLTERASAVTHFIRDTDGVQRMESPALATRSITLASDNPLPTLSASVFETRIGPSENDALVLGSLRKQLAASRVEAAVFQREKKELEDSIHRLSSRVAELNAAVNAYRQSWSWRLSAPLRIFTRVARKARGVASIPMRIMRGRESPGFAAGAEVSAVDGGFLSTGNDPQFQIIPGWDGIKGGWALVDIEITSPEQNLRPILYAFAGPDGSQVTAFPMAGYTQGRERRLIILPVDVRSLRFDPTDRSDVHFAIPHLSVRNLGKIALFREGLASLNAEGRSAVFRAAVRGDLRTVKALVRGGIAGKYENSEYRSWVEAHDTLSAADISAIRAKGAALRSRPLISVLMPVYNPRPKYLRKALDTVLAQTYENWELCIADDASTNGEIRTVLEEYVRRDPRIKVVFREKNGHISAASNSALELVTGEFVALMDHDDALPIHALYMVAEEIVRHPDVDLIYTDEDKVDENDRRHDPHFKTDWNRELFYSQNFVAHMGIYRTSIVRKISGFRVGFEGSQDYDFVLRFLLHTEATRIRHIPHVLYHWRIFPGVASFSTNNPDASIETARRALVEYFEQVEPASEVVGIEQFPSWWRIKRPPPAVLPRVSLIAPTRDRLGVLKVAIDGLLHATNYGNMEVIVVDNESVEPETLEYFRSIEQDPRVKILRVEGAFNFSALNNRAAEIATGSILGFINNDIEVIHDDWLLELVTQASRPNVGVVGAKLYYANDTIQHAGVILGLYGVAAHGHRHFPRNSVGYFGRPMLVQNMSAVTAACMVMPKAVFDQVGGYDETNLTVGYNDVDLCLKAREAGFDVVFTPFAELYHLESVSRGENLSAAQIERDARERAYMLRRWPKVIEADPFYSPNLTVISENFALAFPPRTVKPWRENED
jgi:glycosyltransferase involved in cell wall biosynthesis/ubiquinone/menaquinone biosynthesis C-methylase UbiE